MTAVDLEVRDGTAILILNHPEVKNAIDLNAVQQMTSHLDRLREDETVTTLVITGAGETFASGADISQLLERDQADAFRGINTTLFQRVEDFPRPTIAAVRGWVLGGGLELAMACDLRISGKSGRFGQPEVGLGIMPAAGGCYRLPRLVGLGRAKELIFTGEIIDADEALRIGLVNRVVDDEEILIESLKVAGSIARQDPLAVRISKLALQVVSRPEGIAGQAVETLGQAILFESPEKKRRMQAFLDKRARKKTAKREEKQADG